VRVGAAVAGDFAASLDDDDGPLARAFSLMKGFTTLVAQGIQET